MAGLLGGGCWLLDGAGSGGGQGQRDAFKLLHCLLQVSFWKVVYSQGSGYWWLLLTWKPEKPFGSHVPWELWLCSFCRLWWQLSPEA